MDPLTKILTRSGVAASALSVAVDDGDGHPIRLVALGGDPALDLAGVLRAAFDETGIWPLLVDEADHWPILQFEEGGEPASDGPQVGQAAIDASAAIDVRLRRVAWWMPVLSPEDRLASLEEEHRIGFGLDDDAIAEAVRAVADLQGVQPGLKMVSGPLDAGAILLVPCDQPWEAVVRVGFGGWNDCPNPAEHAAYLRYFFDTVGGTPTAVGHGTVRLDVTRDVGDITQLAELARVVVNYCSELDEFGVASVAQTLSFGPGPWSIWWD
jgi:hypothetical protein